MTFLIIFGIAGLVILGLMSLLWLISLALKNASIVDIFWGAGFVVTGWVYFFLTANDFMLRKWLLLTLVSLWGLRLTLYIGWRNIGKEEDFRYQKWRNEAGKQWWWRSFFKVFLIQGFLMWIISIPLLSAQLRSNSNALNIVDYAGIVVWIIGFFFEAVGDLQLARFKSKPENKGKLLTRGVWRYTRHPNYFGDAAQWWGYYLISTANGGFWTIFSPLFMTLLLLRVSGVALLEKTLKDSKPGYEEYMASTNAFIPWFPRKLKTGQGS